MNVTCAEHLSIGVSGYIPSHQSCLLMSATHCNRKCARHRLCSAFSFTLHDTALPLLLDHRARS